MKMEPGSVSVASMQGGYTVVALYAFSGITFALVRGAKAAT